jgi:hypothetical protein
VVNKGTRFELLVQAIYEEIMSSNEYDTVKVEHDIKLLGRSGQLHQIDIYWEFNLAGVLHRVAVECKDYKAAVSLGRIRDFYGVLDDIGNLNGIFITSKGYQSGAKKFAEHHGISLKVVKEPTAQDIEEYQPLKTVVFNIGIKVIRNVERTFLIDVEWVVKNTDMNDGDMITIESSNESIVVLDSNYISLGSVLDFENKLSREPENTKGLNHTFNFDNAYLRILDSSIPLLKLKGLAFTYDTHTSTESHEVNLKLMAEAVIKDIFTGELHLYNKRVEH